MEDEQQHEKPPDAGGIDLQAGTRRVRVDAQATNQLVGYVGPHLRWVVLAIAFSITIISIFYGISLIWT